MKSLKKHITEGFANVNESKLVFKSEYDAIMKAHKNPYPKFSTNDDFNLDFSIMINQFFDNSVDQKGYETMWAKFNAHYKLGISKAPKPSFLEEMIDTDEDFTSKDLEKVIKDKKPMSEVTGHESVNEFGPMYGSQNRNSSKPSPLVQNVSDLELKIWKSNNSEARFKWDDYADELLSEVEFWAKLDKFDLENARDFAEELIKKYKIK